MSEVKRYTVIGRIETDGGATEEYPGPDELMIHAADYDDLLEFHSKTVTQYQQQCVEKDAVIAERDAEIARLREALENIIKHQTIAAGDMAGGEQLTAVGATLDEALNTGDGVYRP